MASANKKITINNQIFSTDEILEAKLSNFSEYDAKVLSFCQKWISGQDSFSIFTSGSTGKPKEIIISRKQMLISAKSSISALNLKPEYTALSCLSVESVGGMMMIVRAFVSGMSLIIMNPVANPFLEISQKIDFTALVPLQVFEILKNPVSLGKLNNLKVLIIGGAEISVRLQTAIEKLCPDIYHTYGMTETLSHIALKKLNGPDKSDYFSLLDSVKISLDQRGCLIINAPVTNFQDIVTNDLVRIISPDTFLWIGRIDNAVNSGGIKIQLEKIEKAIEKAMYELSAEYRFFLSTIKDEKFGNLIIAVFEGQEFSDDFEENFIEKLKDSLSRYEIPKKFYFIDKFILTKSSKIDKASNMEIIKAELKS